MFQFKEFWRWCILIQVNILDIFPHLRLYNPHSYEEWICVHLDVKSSEGEPTLETRLQLKMETDTFTETF